MSARKLVVWVVVLGSSLVLCAGCRPRRRGAIAYKRVISQLEEKASRLAMENTQLRGDLAESKLMIELLKKEGNTLRGLSTELEEELRARLAGLPGVVVSRSGISVAGRVLFKSGHYELRPEGKTLLKTIANALEDGEEVLRVDGHTDNVAIKHARRRGIKSNRHLSVMRALSVIDVLKDNGVDPNRLFLAGYGEYWPIASNDSKDGRQQNRRVEIVVLPPRAMAISGVSAEEEK